MTRKRFLRLVMGCEISRNEADVIRRAANQAGMSYAAAWEHFKLVMAGAIWDLVTRGEISLLDVAEFPERIRRIVGGAE